jgi:hypothetical protein
VGEGSQGGIGKFNMHQARVYGGRWSGQGQCKAGRWMGKQAATGSSNAAGTRQVDTSSGWVGAGAKQAGK